MQIDKEIKEVLQKIGGNSDAGGVFVIAEVVKVADETCDVKIDSLQLSDVRLAAVVDGNTNNLIVKPKVGSKVLLADFGEGSLRDMAVIGCSEIDSVHVVMNKIEILIENGKVSIKNDQYSLRKAFDDFIAAIEKLTVPTPSGTSSTPVNIAEFKAIGTNLDKFLIE